MCTVDELMIELIHGPRKGSAFLRQAIDEVAAGAWSAPEANAGTLLREARVRPFKQNRRIDLPDGRWRYVDFIWLDLAAVLEIDSDRYHSLPPDADATDARHEELAKLGYDVIHRRPVYIRDHPDEFVRGVVGWLAEVASRRALAS
jgi:very-short-patch-repair endonuclease